MHREGWTNMLPFIGSGIRPLCPPQHHAAHGPLDSRAHMPLVLMMLLCANLGYAAGMGLGRFVLRVLTFVGGAKSALQMQYVLSGDLELYATKYMSGWRYWQRGRGHMDIGRRFLYGCPPHPVSHLSTCCARQIQCFNQMPELCR